MSENNLHNLLSRTDRHALSVGYYTRVAGVACIMIGGVAAVGLIMLFPAYLAHSQDLSIVREEIASLSKGEASFRKDVNDITEFRSSVERVRSHLARVRGTTYLEKVLAAASDAITLESYSFSRSSYTMVLRGVADTRSDLVAFSGSLDSDQNFTSVTVPVDNFSKSLEPPFVITLSLATSTSNL